MSTILFASRYGLQVRHAIYRRKGLCVVAAEGGYSVTHEESGKQVALAETLAKARALVHRLAPLTDWTRDEDWLAERKGLAERVRKAVGK